MQKKHYIILLISILSILFLVYYFLLKNDNTNELSNKFSVTDISIINLISIENKNKTIKLKKKKNTKVWLINNKYEANKKAIKKLLQALSNVKINKPVAKEKIDSINYIIKKYSKKITAYNNNNEIIKTFYISDYDKLNKQTYALANKNDVPYIVSIPGLENNINKRYSIYPLYWIEPEIFKYQPNEITKIKVIFFNKNRISYSIEIEESEPKMFSYKEKKLIKNINKNKILNYLSYFMNVKFSDFNVLNKEKSDSLKNTEADFTIFVEDIYKTTKKVELYKIKIPEKPVKYDFNKLYAIINNEDIVVVKYFDIDLILKDIEYFTE